MILLHFLPQDTRIAELISGISLIVLCFTMLLTGLDPTIVLSQFHDPVFWIITTGVVGVLQLFSLVFCRRLEHLRFLVSWIAGTFWVWITAVGFTAGVTPSEVVGFFVGIANLYAFVVNLLLVKQSWK
jgi:hypothetical protein